DKSYSLHRLYARGGPSAGEKAHFTDQAPFAERRHRISVDGHCDATREQREEPLGALALGDHAKAAFDLLPAPDPEQSLELARRQRAKREPVELWLVIAQPHGTALEDEARDLRHVDRVVDECPGDPREPRLRLRQRPRQRKAAAQNRERAEPEDVGDEIG